MTKHLSFAELESHLARMNLFFRHGRTQKAAELYSGVPVGAGGMVCGVGVSVGDNGGMTSGMDGCSLGHSVVGTRQENALVHDNDSGKVSKLNDRWLSRGGGKTWFREHRNYRRGLFMPSVAERGPKDAATQLWSLRVTEGKTVSGRKFVVTDDWTYNRDDGNDLEAWTGKTTFYSLTNGKNICRVLGRGAGTDGGVGLSNRFDTHKKWHN